MHLARIGSLLLWMSEVKGQSHNDMNDRNGLASGVQYSTNKNRACNQR